MVPQLTCVGVGSAEQSEVREQAASDSGGKGNVKKWAETVASAISPFAQCAGHAIAIHDSGNMKPRYYLLDQTKSFPSSNMGRGNHLLRSKIHRTAESDPARVNSAAGS